MTGPGGAAGRRRRGGGAEARSVRLLVKALEGRDAEAMPLPRPRPCPLGGRLGWAYLLRCSLVAGRVPRLLGGSDEVAPDSAAPQGAAALV